MPPISAGTPSISRSRRPITTRTSGKQRVEIGAGDVAEIFQQHRAGPHLGLRACASCRSSASFFIVTSRTTSSYTSNSTLRLPQAEPLGNLDRFAVMAAPEEADLAVVVERRLDVDLHQRVLAMGAVDLLVRDFDEVGVVQHAW